MFQTSPLELIDLTQPCYPVPATSQSTPWRLGATVSSMSESLQYLTDEHGKRTAVVLPISEYEKLLQDLEDLAVVAERRSEPNTPHAQFVSELKRDGIL
jgi:hypothetical protein